MNFNSLFFPAPRDHYTMCTHFGEMIYIPKVYEMVSKSITHKQKKDSQLKQTTKEQSTQNETSELKPWLVLPESTH
jgi:hypothetical protein